MNGATLLLAMEVGRIMADAGRALTLLPVDARAVDARELLLNVKAATDALERRLRDEEQEN